MREDVTADVLLDGSVSEEDGRALVEVLAEFGVAATMRVLPPRRGEGGALTWLVLVALPIHGFLTVFGGKLAEDGHRRLQTVVGRLLRRATPVQRGSSVPARRLLLRDDDTGVTVALDADLPEAAYRRLFVLDLSAVRGTLRYDTASGTWQDDPPPA